MIDGAILGVQRLSLLAPDREGEILQHALDGGVRWVDTADVYGLAPGQSERQLGALLPALPGLQVATKGGLVREGSRWRTEGSPRHLEWACEMSCERLGLEQIALYQLHAPDPRAWQTQLRALARLHQRGLVRAVGLCNVRAGELAQALELVPVATLQVEISPQRPHATRSGVVELAMARGVQVLAYRPLGGAEGIGRLLRDPVLCEVARSREIPVPRLVLAWLRGLGLVPLAGPTTRASVDELLAAWSMTLDDEAKALLDSHFEAGRLLTRRHRAPPPAAEGEVVLVMGSPGAGKTSRAMAGSSDLRLNRDDRGGTLEGLVPLLRQALAEGGRRVVLDNTYASRASRRPVIEAAREAGVPVRCEWLVTPEDEAEINLVHRILETVGRLPEPHEFEPLCRKEPGVVPPRALSRYRQDFEPPSLEEGFARVDAVPFVRRAAPELPARALVLDPRDLVPALQDTLRAKVEEGFVPVVIGWEPARDEATQQAVLERVRRDGEALGLSVRAWSCPHPSGPPACWCRKPLPGLLVVALRELGCDPARSVALGRQPVDRSLARKLGMPVLGV